MQLEMRGKGKKQTRDSEMLTGDCHLLAEDIIVFKILVRLPAVDVIRCTSICKQWNSLIRTSHFISAHLSLSSSSSSSRSSQSSLFVDHYSSSLGRRVLSCHFDPQSLDHYRIIPFPFPLPRFFIIPGPIHGLFCLYNNRDKLYCLWNPSVRRYIPLPSPISHFNVNMISRIARGFGFDDKSNDYKLVLLAFLTSQDNSYFDTPNCQLFSLKQGRWRTLVANEAAKDCIASGNGLFVKGALHWMAGKRRNEDRLCPFVLAFDIALETFKEMELPHELLVHGGHNFSILETKGSLACFEYDFPRPIQEPQGINNCYSIWVMKEYGVANSWVKMWTFSLAGKLARVYGFWGNGDEILIQKEGNKGTEHLFLYDTKTQGIRDFGGVVKPYIFGICTCDESLILLDKQSGAISYEELTPDANPLSEEHQYEEKEGTKRRKTID